AKIGRGIVTSDVDQGSVGGECGLPAVDRGTSPLGGDRGGLRLLARSCGTLGSPFFFQAEDGIRDYKVTGVQTCALPIFGRRAADLRPDIDKDGKPVRVSSVRSQISSAPANVKDEVEPAFVNDNYWFIFPFHAYWDTSAIVTVKDMQKLPLGKGSAKLVSVKYPPEVGGYTPGDTWDLFLGSDGRVKEFTYHRGGPKKPSLLSTTWAGYKKAGPLLVSTDHRGIADGKAARIF